MFPLLGHRRVPTFNLHVNVCYFFLERNKTNNPVLLSDPAHRWRSWGWPWAPRLVVTRSAHPASPLPPASSFQLLWAEGPPPPP